jgi:hypothetical protein
MASSEQDRSVDPATTAVLRAFEGLLDEFSERDVTYAALGAVLVLVEHLDGERVAENVLAIVARIKSGRGFSAESLN